MTSGETVSSQLRESLFPYMMEAGLEPELLCGGRDVLAQGLLWFFVVDKRKRELDDIAEGNCNYRRCFPVVMLCSQLHLEDCEMSLCSGFSVDSFLLPH